MGPSNKSSLPAPHENVVIRILVSLPYSYPEKSPPQLQLLSRYVGAFGADSDLFGSVLRTFISVNGVEWASEVCVFDGLQNVIERCVTWYEDRLSADKAVELVREDARDQLDLPPTVSESGEQKLLASPSQPPTVLDGIEIIEAEAITDRKSVFVGRACRISHPSQVSLDIPIYLLSEMRIRLPWF
jgi:secreted protein with Ig-like and vWFA domain